MKNKEKKRDATSTSFVEKQFMSRLLLLKDRISLENLQHQIFSFVGAGYETTGNASAHCILFLALHPEIQEKAYREILSIYPNKNSVVDSKSLLELDYLDRVIKESLRLAPAAPNIGREALADFELSPGRVAKKGTIFCVDIVRLHRQKHLWGEDADEFNPDRFLHENFADKKQFYIPFSAGKRNCIGKLSRHKQIFIDFSSYQDIVMLQRASKLSY